MLLPTDAADLLATLVGKRLVGVRRQVEGRGGPGSLADDGVRGALELELDDGTRLHATADAERRSVLLAEGPLAVAGPLEEVASGAFWRWRLRRAISGVVVWKSLDVAERARELEFGVEVALAGTRGFVVELIDDEGVPTLVVTDGSAAERHRAIRVAGSGSAAPADRVGRSSRQPSPRDRRAGTRRHR